MKTIYTLPLVALFLATFSMARDIPGNEKLDYLTPSDQFETNLQKLVSLTPKKTTTLKPKPWIDYAWRHNHGLLGERYNQSSFKKMSTFQERYSWFSSQRNLLQGVKIEELSPAEKYDLLVGDENFTLTKAQWYEAKRYFDNDELSSWTGICEGTAASSVMVKEPKKTITMTSPKGQKIPFYPLDVKGLASLFWSAYTVDVPVIGARCEVRDHNQDLCASTNAGTVFLALLHYLGQTKHHLFFDVSTSGIVNNFPVLGYELNWVNLKNNMFEPNLEGAKMSYQEYKSLDLNASKRSSNIASIVGVEMIVYLSVGNTEDRMGQGQTSEYKMNLEFDLELDQSGKILGGEWKSFSRPGYLWVLEENMSPKSQGDILLSPDPTVWIGQSVPKSWLDSIKFSSERLQPVKRILNHLIEQSSH